mmetsp:Transcript_33231/g.95369  ORF Transcript_33231/g.95369 Transcript_33231/m.95369 type:complete len:316 (-) Transcript_33231:108-1055(-)
MVALRCGCASRRPRRLTSTAARTTRNSLSSGARNPAASWQRRWKNCSLRLRRRRRTAATRTTPALGTLGTTAGTQRRTVQLHGTKAPQAIATVAKARTRRATMLQALGARPPHSLAASHGALTVATLGTKLLGRRAATPGVTAAATVGTRPAPSTAASLVEAAGIVEAMTRVGTATPLRMQATRVGTTIALRTEVVRQPSSSSRICGVLGSRPQASERRRALGRTIGRPTRTSRRTTRGASGRRSRAKSRRPRVGRIGRASRAGRMVVSDNNSRATTTTGMAVGAADLEGRATLGVATTRRSGLGSQVAPSSLLS